MALRRSNPVSSNAAGLLRRHSQQKIAVSPAHRNERCKKYIAATAAQK